MRCILERCVFERGGRDTRFSWVSWARKSVKEAGDKLFKKFYWMYKNKKKVDANKIKERLKNEKQDLSDSTVNRRASTIKAWVEWMYLIDSKKNNNCL